MLPGRRKPWAIEVKRMLVAYAFRNSIKVLGLRTTNRLKLCLLDY